MIVVFRECSGEMFFNTVGEMSTGVRDVAPRVRSLARGSRPDTPLYSIDGRALRTGKASPQLGVLVGSAGDVVVGPGL
jgi:hypothetical protein